MNTKRIPQHYCRSSADSAGNKLITISIAQTRLLSKDFHLSALETEIWCLEQGIVPLRYLRNIGTIGTDGQARLLQSTATVCGAGGLGGTIIELLARQGFGRIVIIDGGKFDETNLNRQILSTESDMRKSKAGAALKRTKLVNSSVCAVAIRQFITDTNAIELLSGADIVLDGLDNLPARMLAASACTRLGIPFIHGAIAGFNGQIMSIFPHDKGLSAVYGDSLDNMSQGLEAVTGNPPTTPAIVAALQVQEAVKIITGIGIPLRNRLLFLDFSESSLEEIIISRDK